MVSHSNEFIRSFCVSFLSLRNLRAFAVVTTKFKNHSTRLRGIDPKKPVAFSGFSIDVRFAPRRIPTSDEEAVSS